MRENGSVWKTYICVIYDSRCGWGDAFVVDSIFLDVPQLHLSIWGVKWAPLLGGRHEHRQNDTETPLRSQAQNLSSPATKVAFFQTQISQSKS